MFSITVNREILEGHNVFIFCILNLTKWAIECIPRGLPSKSGTPTTAPTTPQWSFIRHKNVAHDRMDKVGSEHNVFRNYQKVFRKTFSINVISRRQDYLESHIYGNFGGC